MLLTDTARMANSLCKQEILWGGTEYSPLVPVASQLSVWAACLHEGVCLSNCITGGLGQMSLLFVNFAYLKRALGPSIS